MFQISPCDVFVSETFPNYNHDQDCDIKDATICMYSYVGSKLFETRHRLASFDSKKVRFSLLVEWKVKK